MPTPLQIIAEDPELSTLLTAMTAAGVAFEFQGMLFSKY